MSNTQTVRYITGKIDFLKRVLTDVNSTVDLPLYNAIKTELDEWDWKLADAKTRAFASIGLRQLTDAEIDASWANVEDDTDQ